MDGALVIDQSTAPHRRLAIAMYNADVEDGVTREDWDEVDNAYTEAAKHLMAVAGLVGNSKEES